MKFTYTLLLSILTLLPIQSIAQTNVEEFTFLSYNIRFNNPHDNENWWGHRKEAVVDLITNEFPIAFGVQEAVLDQMTYIDNNTPGYSYIGVGRDDGKTKGEFSAIFYNTNKLNVLKSGTFWLSGTPNEVSKGWDAALPRVCTYAQFEHKDSGIVFWLFNTHFDHVGNKARVESAKLIAAKIDEFTEEDAPVILTGDFNLTPDTEAMTKLRDYLQDGALAKSTDLQGPIGTFSGFKLDAPLDRRIDYIYSKNVTVNAYKHLDTKRPNGLWVSDHLPVVSKVAMKKP
ncbi:endonuclease/exonuclease/phosphatase [Roseivirga pacifica]|uniref:endonuclease/exonuclease/phosphatase family protein n=1 Tax=Roseivirga pacifica TaxID=1267423 RepID=UPI0020953B44|nr:endonuclease/exonuclease/phosphatase family protein [Roseivirga pacifica]MCO6358422.1 endonuclease/exonuclease/phosphatase [Roseivirga pacifica]MCO6368977.1 endonuclease/exonuclease/phosphatase [Roseivirga pacifica]MCO6374153.1 endonuclease/exonuclease/phosphatase [Roseivirga pacifica]MCO6381050.1 endonuclease/exonuclease/phosphatase [Roseivirga pacifica]